MIRVVIVEPDGSFVMPGRNRGKSGKVEPRCVSEAFFWALQTKIKPIELAARWACFVSDEMDQT